jgi:hypothetical protein
MRDLKRLLVASSFLLSALLAPPSLAAATEAGAEELRWACFYMLIFEVPPTPTAPPPCQQLKEKKIDSDFELVSRGLQLLAPDKYRNNEAIEAFLKIDPARYRSLADKYYFHDFLGRAIETTVLKDEKGPEKFNAITQAIDAYLKEATALKQSPQGKEELSKLLEKYFEWLMRNYNDERAFNVLLAQENLIADPRLAFFAISKNLSNSFGIGPLKSLSRRLTDKFGIDDWRGGAIVSVISLSAISKPATEKSATPGKDDLFPIFDPIWRKSGLLAKKPQIASWYLKRASVFYMKKQYEEADKIFDYVYAESKTTKLEIGDYALMRRWAVMTKIALNKYGEAKAIGEAMEAVWQRDYYPTAILGRNAYH